MACLSCTLEFCKQIDEVCVKQYLPLEAIKMRFYVIFVEDLLQSSRNPQLVARVERPLDAGSICKRQQLCCLSWARLSMIVSPSHHKTAHWHAAGQHLRDLKAKSLQKKFEKMYLHLGLC